MPIGEQLSAVIPHATHAPPSGPHAETDGTLQLVPEQQPAHVFPQPLHTPALHVSSLGHATHADPPDPHAPALSPLSQLIPLQHPEHDTPSHTQTPPRQCWPSFSRHDVSSHVHAPPTQWRPAPHGAPVPHKHAPVFEQLSEAMGSHATHVAPFTPHVPSDLFWQAPLASQHPVGHVLPSQTHFPATQS